MFPFGTVCGDFFGKGLVYSVKNNEYSVTGYKGTDTDVVIPRTYRGYPVTSIGKEAFSSCSSLTSVYYKGNAEQWGQISGSDETELENATKYYYSESEPAINAEGTAYDDHYWHYDENYEIVVWVYKKID